jgi:hypothetical protein
MMPYYQADNQSQMSSADAEMFVWFYGLRAVQRTAGRPEEHSQPAPDIELGEQLLPDGPTLEIGVFYGGSLWFAAQRARLLNTVAWGLDEFGRPGSKFAAEPTALVAAAHLAAEGLAEHVRFAVGNSCDDRHKTITVSTGVKTLFGLPAAVDLRQSTRAEALPDDHFAGAMSGADHSGRWALTDIPLCNRIVKPGGYIAVHAMHGSPEHPSDRYDDPRLNAPDGRPYERVVRDFAAGFGWDLVRRAPGSSLEVYRKP